MDRVLDEQLEVLSNVHRRRLLCSLMRHNPQSDRPAAAGRAGRSDEDRNLTIELRHVHLPKLEARGYVDWDRSSGTVTKGPRFDELEALLTVLLENRDVIPGEIVR